MSELMMTETGARSQIERISGRTREISLGYPRISVFASTTPSSRLCTISHRALAHLLITSKSKNRDTSIYRPVRRPRNGRQVAFEMAKRYRTVATILGSMPSMKDLQSLRPLSHPLVGSGASYALLQDWERREAHKKYSFCRKSTHI